MARGLRWQSTFAVRSQFKINCLRGGFTIIFGIIPVIALLVLLIPIGGVGALAVLGGKAAGWDWNIATITAAVVLGCVAFAILILAMALISVPVAVFFPGLRDLFFCAARFAAGGLAVASTRGSRGTADTRLAASSARPALGVNLAHGFEGLCNPAEFRRWNLLRRLNR
jgi:hypothetical protein